MTEAQIYSQGYRRYEGIRTGLPGAVRTLVVHSVRHALGLGRAARFKIVPAAIIIFAYLPAAVFIGLTALIPEGLEDVLPSYASYYGYVVAAIYLLAGFVAPQLLCPDRRTGMLGVYLSSPLNRPTYLLGKLLAVLALLLTVTLGPPLLMLIAFSLESVGPSGFTEWIEVFVKIVLSSLVMGGLYAAIGLAISASTDRWVVATATILAVMPGSAIVTDILAGPAEVDPVVRLANIPNLPREIIFRIHDEPGLWSPRENPTWTLWLAWLLWMAASFGFIWYRYRRLLVRR